MGRISKSSAPIAICRREMGLTQAKFSSMLGISREQLAKIETSSELPAQVRQSVQDRLDKDLAVIIFEAYDKPRRNWETRIKDLFEKCASTDLWARATEQDAPLDLRIESTNVNPGSIQKMTELLEKLASLFGGESRAEINIRVRHHLPASESSTKLKNTVFACLARSSLADPVEVAGPQGSLQYEMQLGDLSHSPIGVAVRGLGRFPKMTEKESRAKRRERRRRHEVPAKSEDR